MGGFILGCLLGGSVVAVLLCSAQIERINEYEHKLRDALIQARVNHEDAMYYKEKCKKTDGDYFKLLDRYKELGAEHSQLLLKTMEDNNGKEN